MGPVLKLQLFFGRNVSLLLKLLHFLLDKTMWFYFECFVEKLVQGGSFALWRFERFFLSWNSTVMGNATVLTLAGDRRKYVFWLFFLYEGLTRSRLFFYYDCSQFRRADTEGFLWWAQSILWEGKKCSFLFFSTPYQAWSCFFTWSWLTETATDDDDQRWWEREYEGCWECFFRPHRQKRIFINWSKLLFFAFKFRIKISFFLVSVGL